MKNIDEEIKILNRSLSLNTFDVFDIVTHAYPSDHKDVAYPIFIKDTSPLPMVLPIITSKFEKYLVSGILMVADPMHDDKPIFDKPEKIEVSNIVVPQQTSVYPEEKFPRKDAIGDKKEFGEKGKLLSQIRTSNVIAKDIKKISSSYPENRGNELSLKIQSSRTTYDEVKSRSYVNLKQIESRHDSARDRYVMQRRSRSRERSSERDRYSGRQLSSRSKYVPEKIHYYRRSHSRSRGRRSRSRSKYRKSRSLSRERYEQQRTGKRSRSKGLIEISSDARSRSSSPSRNRDSKSKQKHSKTKRSKKETQLDALTSLKEIHLKECNMYRKCPEAHPEFLTMSQKWKRINPYKSFLSLEWKKYMTDKLEVLFKEGWEDKKKRCLSLLSSSSSSSSSSESSDSSYERRKKKKKKKQKKKLKDDKKERKEEVRQKPIADLMSVKLKPNLLLVPDRTLVRTHVREPYKVDDWMKKPSAVTSCEKSPPPVVNPGKNLSKINDFVDMLSILTQIGDKFGVLSMSLLALQKSVLNCQAVGKDPLSCIDDDAIMLLTLVNDKVNLILKNKSLSLVQTVIMQEAQERIVPFLAKLKNEDPKKEVNIKLIAEATNGKSVSEIINYIKNTLRDRGTPQNDVMKIYLDVKNAQISMGNIEKSHSPSVSTRDPGPSSSLPMQQDFTFLQRPPPRFLNNDQNKSNVHSLPSHGYLHSQYPPVREESREDYFKKEFMAMTMKERILKFCQFNELEADEQSFLTAQLKTIEQTDVQLAKVLHSVMYKK